MKTVEESETRAGVTPVARRPLWWRRSLLVGGLIIVLLMGAMASGMMNLLANTLLFSADLTMADPLVRPLHSREAIRPVNLFNFKALDLHPDRLYRPYVAGSVHTPDSSKVHVYSGFRQLLDLYQTRQGVDDNFTIRVLDNRSNEVLEVYTMTDVRSRYLRGESFDWLQVDRQRRAETKRLVDKYVELGVPKADVSVRWGRSNQVAEARVREAPYLEYEIRLAKYLGMSLLATEIGTVETFNTDEMVSQVGARSRYQMMPYLLRKNKIHHYQLTNDSGGRVRVFEEWHPLLTMESAFTLMRGYTNAVGHELPGLSAYHTGPYNIFKIYQLYLAKEGLEHPNPPSVVEAFMWGLTSGFDEVASSTSFKSNSRGYIPAVYGSLRAIDAVPIDTMQTLQVERVQLKDGAQILLRDLLGALEEKPLRWGATHQSQSLYNRFRQLNPHILLPGVPDSVGVPDRGDLRLSDTAEGVQVRFFLPLGATKVLAADRPGVIDEAATFRFDRKAYVRPPESERTTWDRQYDALIQETSQFGFTEQNRERLNALAERFRVLAEANPSHYRQMQLRIIETHRDVWKSERWDVLAATVAAAFGQSRVPVYPPGIVEADSLEALYK